MPNLANLPKRDVWEIIEIKKVGLVWFDVYVTVNGKPHPKIKYCSLDRLKVLFGYTIKYGKELEGEENRLLFTFEGCTHFCDVVDAARSCLEHGVDEDHARQNRLFREITTQDS